MASLFQCEESHIKALPIKVVERLYLYHTDTRGHILGKVYSISEDIEDKIIEVFKGKDEHEIKAMDKVYILPGNDLPLNRIKEFVKSKKATVTKDISKATVICGNSNVYDTGDINLTSTLLFCTEDMYLPTGEDSISKDQYKSAFTGGELIYSDYKKLAKAGVDVRITSKAYRESGYISGLKWLTEKEHYVFPVTLEMIYYILKNKIKVVTQKYMSENAHSGLDISDPEVYESINGMLGSSDHKNTELAIEILAHAKLDMKNPMTVYHIHKLGQHHYNKISRKAHLKNVAHFVSMSDFYHYAALDVAEFLLSLEKNNMLDSRVFNLCYADLKAETEGYYHDSPFYEEVDLENKYSVHYKLKEKYQKIMETE